MPWPLRRLLRAVRHGALRIHIDVKELEQFGERLDRSISRLTVGMITAAFIVGTSVMLSVTGGTELLGMSILASLGSALAALGGVWVLVSIMRGRHQDGAELQSGQCGWRIAACNGRPGMRRFILPVLLNYQ